MEAKPTANSALDETKKNYGSVTIYSSSVEERGSEKQWKVVFSSIQNSRNDTSTDEYKSLKNSLKETGEMTSTTEGFIGPQEALPSIQHQNISSGTPISSSDRAETTPLDPNAAWDATYTTKVNQGTTARTHLR